MEPRVSLVTLGVAEVARSRAFYERLGWRASPASNEHVAFFQAGGMVVALWGKDALAQEAHLKPTAPGAVALAQNQRTKGEVDALLAAAKAAGATILTPAHDTFWGGYSGYFADPDGHPWEVAWNPFWTLAADGTVQLPS